MVTTAPTRTPHALQSGMGTGALWLLDNTLGVACGVAAILLIPFAGRRYSWVDGVLTPDATLLAGLAVALGVMAVLFIVRRLSQKFLDMHLLGRLLDDAPPPTRVPALTFVLLSNTALILAAFYSATHSTGDVGLTKVMLFLLGIGGLSALPGQLLLRKARKRPGWGSEAVLLIMDRVLVSVGLIVAGTMASEGVLSQVPADLTISFVVAVLITSLFVACLVGAAQEEREEGKPGVNALLRTFSGRVVDTMVASPTIKHYETGYRLAVATAVTVLGVVVVGGIGMNFVLP